MYCLFQLVYHKIDWIYSSQQITQISRQWDYNKILYLYSNAKIYGSKCGELKKKVGTLNESEIEWIIRCGMEFLEVFYQEVMVGGLLALSKCQNKYFQLTNIYGGYNK